MRIKNITSSCAFLLCSLIITAQSTLKINTDSIENKLKSMPEDTHKVNTLKNLAVIYANTNVDKSIKLGEEAFILAKKLNLKNVIVSGLAPLSFQYSISGQWAKGLELALEGKQMSKNDPYNLANFINMEQLAYEKQGDYIRCLDACFENIKLFNKFPDSSFSKIDKWATYMTASQMFTHLNKPDSALSFAQKSMHYANEIYDISIHFNGYSHNALGLAYLGNNMPDSAITHFHLMENMCIVTNNQFALQETQVYLAKAMKQKNQLDSMLYYAQTAYDSAVVMGNEINQMDAGLLLSEYFESINPKKALYYLQIHNRIKEKFFTQEQTNKRYFLESKEKAKIADLERQEIVHKSKIKQNSLLGGLFTLLLLALVLWYSNKRKKSLNDKLNSQNHKIENQNLELVKTTNELFIKNRSLAIEAALEKVRAVSLSMKHSDELEKVISIFFEKLKELGLEFDGGAGIHLFSDDSKDAIIWVYAPFQPPTKINLPDDPEAFLNNPIIIDVWNSYTTGTHIFNKTYSLEEKNRYFNYVFEHNDFNTIPEEARNYILSVPNYTSTWVAERHSLIGANSWTGQKFSEEDFEILKRVAKVFDQAYVRFLDLQKAELQTREAQIETAVERVRAQSMAMHHADDLTKVNQELLIQLNKLNIEGLTGVAFYLVDSNEFVTVWDLSSPGNLGDPNSCAFKFDARNYPTLGEFVEILKNGKQDYFVLDYPKDKLSLAVSELQHIQPNVAQQFKNAMDSGILQHQWNPAARLSNGMLAIDLMQPPKDEIKNIVLKMAGAFNLAYQRFLDLQKAEAQAREAQIEAVLERIRNRALVMNSSLELNALINGIYNECVKLDMNLDRSLIITYDKETNDSRWWIAGPEAKGESTGHLVPYHDYRPSLALLKGWHDRAQKWSYVYEGEDKRTWNEYVFKHTELKDLPPPMIKGMNELPRVIFNCSFQNFGCIMLPTTEPMSDEHFELMVRLSKVIDLAYTRYLHLQFKEEQAREAQIEASLERVRSRTMAMQHSDELAEAASILFSEVNKLGVNAFASVFHIWEPDMVSTKCWANGGEGLQPPLRIPHTVEPFHKRIFDAWKKGEQYFEMVAEGAELEATYRFMHSLINGSNVLDNIENSGFAIPKMQFTHCAFFQQGYIMINAYEKPNISPEVYIRFGKVFEQTYTRFLDLQKAEEQAKEAHIEATLERVRSRTMEMQSSNELREVVAIIYRQLLKVGFGQGALGIVIMEKDTGNMDWWMAGFDKVDYPENFYIPYFDHPFYLGQLNAWKENKKFVTIEMSGDSKIAYDQVIFTKTGFTKLTSETQEIMKSIQHVTFNNANMKYGALSWGIETLDNNQAQILQRFAVVFEQTYTRFLDLQVKEKQIKDTQIEVVLERIRSRAMSMDTSEELNTLIGFIFTQCSQLDMRLDRGFIMTFDKQTKDAYWWMVSADTPNEPLKFLVKYHEYPPNLAILKGWQNRDQKWSYLLEGDNKKTWDDYQFANDLSKLPDLVKHNMRSVNSVILNASFQNFGCIMLSSFYPLTDDHFDLLIRLSKVFELTYTRFMDLKLKEESTLKLAEEKQKLEVTLTDLRSTQAQLIQSEKMASLGELTAGIAHEIQNPLNFVNNFSELSADLAKELKVEVEKAEIDKELVIDLAIDLCQNQEKINHHGKRASDIVKGMLEHSRKSTGQKEETDINVLCDEYLRLAYHGYKAKDKNFHAVYTTNLDRALPKISVVTQDIGRVLLNIINNAFYTVNERSKKEESAYQPTVSITTKVTDNNQLLVAINDNGSGIPHHIKDKIFQPFFTTKPTGQGTGLGLSLSYDIMVKGHGGVIEVESVKGEGTTFILKLPLEQT